MARIIDMYFPATCTSVQRLRFLKLALEGVSSFSSYTSDPVIGSYLTANPTTRITTSGVHPTSTTISSNATIVVVEVGNVRYRLIDVSTTAVIGASADNVLYLGNLASGLSVKNIRLCLGLNHLAYANEPDTTISPTSELLARSGNSIIHIGAFTNNAGLSTAIVASPPDPYVSGITATVLTNSVQFMANLVTNFGPASIIPAYQKFTSGGLQRKPVFSVKVASIDGNVFDISTELNMLYTVYGDISGQPRDYTPTVLNNAITYTAAGNYLFA